MVPVAVVGVLVGCLVDEGKWSRIESNDRDRGSCGSVVMARCASSRIYCAPSLNDSISFSIQATYSSFHVSSLSLEPLGMLVTARAFSVGLSMVVIFPLDLRLYGGSARLISDTNNLYSGE